MNLNNGLGVLLFFLIGLYIVALIAILFCGIYASSAVGLGDTTFFSLIFLGTPFGFFFFLIFIGLGYLLVKAPAEVAKGTDNGRQYAIYLATILCILIPIGTIIGLIIFYLCGEKRWQSGENEVEPNSIETQVEKNNEIK